MSGTGYISPQVLRNINIILHLQFYVRVCRQRHGYKKHAPPPPKASLFTAFPAPARQHEALGKSKNARRAAHCKGAYAPFSFLCTGPLLRPAPPGLDAGGIPLLRCPPCQAQLHLPPRPVRHQELCLLRQAAWGGQPGEAPHPPPGQQQPAQDLGPRQTIKL